MPLDGHLTATLAVTTVEELHPYGVAIATRKIDEASDGETQTHSERDSIESAQMPDIVYGWSNVHLTDSPCLKEKIGAAATVGIQLTVSSHRSFRRNSGSHSDLRPGQLSSPHTIRCVGFN